MTFARQDSWKGHTHSKVRSFLCSICGKTFARRNIRDTHERAHLNDRRYPCSYCGKKFMTNQQRTNHERTHTGEKPFQVCFLLLQGVKKNGPHDLYIFLFLGSILFLTPCTQILDLKILIGDFK